MFAYPFGRPITRATFLRLDLLILLFVALLLVVLLALMSPAKAGNTTFLTDKNGNVVFPFSPPNRATSGPATIDNTTLGATTPKDATVNTLTVKTAIVNQGAGINTTTQGAPAAATVSATLTAANLQTGIITVLQGAAGASAQQLPLATAMDTAFPGSIAGTAFDFSVINISTNAAESASLTTNTGWTLVGDMDIAANSAATTKSAGRFRARKTGTGAWVLYRIS